VWQEKLKPMTNYSLQHCATQILLPVQVCPLKNPKGRVYPWRSTDQEEEDMARGLLPSGWRRVGDPLYLGDDYYPGIAGESRVAWEAEDRRQLFARR